MTHWLPLRSSTFAARLLFGFIAGFIATLIFHQIGLLFLHFVGMTPNMPYNMNPVPPLGVAQFISLSFWGGVWGVMFVMVERYRSPSGYWVGAIIFGAIFPTAVAWFIVRPLKGLAVADVFRIPGIFIGPIVNGLWGLGTALFLGGCLEHRRGWLDVGPRLAAFARWGCLATPRPFLTNRRDLRNNAG